MSYGTRSAPIVPMTPDGTFRYAPLSRGLEMVRKALGQHEIATVQTTSATHRKGRGTRGLLRDP
jgi:hypothetical protein